MASTTGVTRSWYSKKRMKKEINMSNSDELRHTDNTTLVPPRFSDTLLQVYHRRRPTLGLLILPYVSPFPPTIRRTARISILPIEPNLVERARISAINLDDYQLDPVTPPPSPSSPFTMAAYQRMIAETDPTQREEALTETGQNSVLVPETALTVCTTRLREQLHTILEDIDRHPNTCLEELEAFMSLWDVKPRVEERGSTIEEEGGTRGSGPANLPKWHPDGNAQTRSPEPSNIHRSTNQNNVRQYQVALTTTEYSTNSLFATRVTEALAAVVVTHAASHFKKKPTEDPTLPEQDMQLQGILCSYA
ncbi:hypothetical protein Tco_0681456 [Tanacetum coccineum]|uniref:Uncharacterized protein n=1 Tax=Tanacetum coccineum TaxID=301880 RepID=A0ABQ4XPB4_9ASTR